MVYPSSQDGVQSIPSHLHELTKAWPIANGSIQDLDNVTLDATPRILPENNETNTSSQRMIDGNFHAENNTIRGIVTGAKPQPTVVDNSGSNNTRKMSFKLFEGQEFRNSDAFDMALREHAICLNFEYKPTRSSHDRIVKECDKDGCPWHIHASKVPGGSSFRIETLESNHTHELTKLARNHQASEKWIANFIKGQVRKYLDSKPNDIVADIGREYGIEVSYHIARRGRDLALREEHIGCSIRDLAAYCDKVERTNPGSFVTLGFPSHGLLGIFIAYRATIFGFQNACRPIITLHSRNFGGDYPHIWLYATGLDAGYNSFLVAYALVESSNEETWTWFCDQLAHILVATPKITIITVKQENSSKAVYCSFPDACHRYCCKRLYEDFGRKFRDKNLRLHFLRAIAAESEANFSFHMDEISSISPEAQKWINEISPSPKYWAVFCFDGQQDCEHNHPIVEEFDIWSDDRNATTSSVISILRHFHAKMREIFLRNRVEESSDQALRQLTPYALTRLDRVNLTVKLSSVSATHNLRTQFYIESTVDGGPIVDLSERTCRCRIWQLHKFPCCHAVAAISILGSDVSNYCEHYTVAKFREAYLEFIHPISDDLDDMKDTSRTSRAKKRTHRK
ncbi:hypothetical protein AAC387_Pa04g0954 [Persea americana]